jgi:hypothetical protein
LDTGRFDLVVNGGGVTEPAVIVIESKIESDFGPKQLERYRAELCRPDSFPGVAAGHRYLVILTISPQRSPFIQGSITWPQVYAAILAKKRNQAPHIAAVFADFADFLKEKGLSMLELMKIDNRIVTGWFEAKKLETQFERIIERLRNIEEIKGIVGRRQVKQDGNEWIGVHGTSAFYAGFGFFPGKGKAEIAIWVEITIPGDRRDLIEGFDSELQTAFRKAKHYLQLSDDDDAVNFNNLSKEASRFVFVEAIEGDLNGDGERTFHSLSALARKVIALSRQPRNMKRTRLRR